ncbi:MAG: hypothetical protein LUC18_01350, partial [Porphyromonadaceae bacterium]|nr:hypothetical protein [Porphyromonadaceae bacterium]
MTLLLLGLFPSYAFSIGNSHEKMGISTEAFTECLACLIAPYGTPYSDKVSTTLSDKKQGNRHRDKKEVRT